MSPEPAWEAVIRLAASDVLNLNDREHWRLKANKSKYIRQLAEQIARASRAPHLKRALLTVEIAFPDRKRRDPHNWMATVKPIVDGLVKAGVLPDDDAAHLDGPDMRLGAPDSRLPTGWHKLTINITDIMSDKEYE